MHVLHVTILQYKFVYSSNQERSKLKSTEEGAHFSFRMKFGTGKMTTTVVMYIKFWVALKFYFLIFRLFSNGEYSLYGNLVSPNYSPVMHFFCVSSVIYLLVLA